MAWKRVVTEMGMGTDIRGGDYTKAAVRALRDALWHNSLSVTRALGMDVDSMRVEVLIGVPKPEAVDTAQVLAILPHGTGEVKVVHGGLQRRTRASQLTTQQLGDIVIERKSSSHTLMIALGTS